MLARSFSVSTVAGRGLGLTVALLLAAAMLVFASGAGAADAKVELTPQTGSSTGARSLPLL